MNFHHDIFSGDALFQLLKGDTVPKEWELLSNGLNTPSWWTMAYLGHYVSESACYLCGWNIVISGSAVDAADQHNLFSPSSGRGFSEEDKSVTAPSPLSLSVLDLLHANTTYTQIHVQDA